jgi:murein DD-endopeptidase MepM/ murein hydrolase activator NlpD
MTPYLAGNFGELRPNHFHGGLDFKTQGTTGHPVYAFDDGYVARAAINAYGYGWVLYVAHPSGLTTVYGHLSTFSDSIMARVRAYQMAHEENNPDITFAPGDLPVHRGQQIALSGNTGSSGGPHVHFEVRDTELGEYYDPMVFFLDKITDTMAPEIRGLYLYPLGGVVNGATRMQSVALASNGRGGKTVPRTPTAWGRIGVGIKAYDRMDGTSNIYGVKAVRLYVDDSLVYSFQENNFVYEEHRFTNSVTDYREWRQNRSMIMKSFREPGNHLRMIRRAVDDGVLDIREERLYHLRYELQDAHGNKTTLPFTLRGQRAPLPEPQPIPAAHRGEPGRAFRLDTAGFRFEAPEGTFYTEVALPLKVQTAPDPNRPCVSPIYRLGDDNIPLHGYCTLTIDLPADVADTAQLYIACLNGGSTPMVSHALPARKGRPTALTAEVRQLGSYAIRRDTSAPTATLVSASARSVTFKIGDAGSGIASWRGTIDGRFVPFMLNAQGQVVAHPAEYGIKGAGHKVRLAVRDHCGNEKTVQVNY